jgi:hypothetical protein
MEKELTVSQAMLLDQKWFDELAEKIETDFGKTTEKISEFMEQTAEDIKSEEFGDLKDKTLSKYERKLIMVGYLIGIEKGRDNPMNMLMEHLLSQHLRKGE